MAVFLGVLKGFTLIGNIVQTTALIFGGYFVKLLDIAKLLPGVSTLTGAMGSAFTTAGGGLAGFKAALLPLISPIGLIVIGIAAAAAVFALMYIKSEELRDAIRKMAEVLLGNLMQAWEKISAAIEKYLPTFESVNNTFQHMGDLFAKYIVPVLQILLVGAIEFVANRIVAFIKIVGGIITIFSAMWSFVRGIFALMRGDFDGVAKHFGDAFKGLVSGLGKIFSGIYTYVTAPFKAAFNVIVRAWNATIGRLPGVPNLPLWSEKDAYAAPKIDSITFPSGAAPVTVKRMALGGTVYPSSGGSLVRVAEAGRPERIEPLNDAGLSKRDIAMIKLMSGGSAGGQTFNIYPAPKMDETELAALVSRQLAFQLRAGSI
jgi:hypothetical protein